MYVEPKLKEGDLVLIKDHTAKAFQLDKNFRVVTQRGNKVEVKPAEDGELSRLHVTDVKKILPADQAITQLPDSNKLGRLTKLRLNPRDILDMNWQITSELNIDPALNYHKVKNKHITLDHFKVKMDFKKREGCGYITVVNKIMKLKLQYMYEIFTK